MKRMITCLLLLCLLCSQTVGATVMDTSAPYFGDYLFVYNPTDTNQTLSPTVSPKLAPAMLFDMQSEEEATTEEVEEGEALPTPTSDIEGNKFLGWYTDTTWTTKVETYEEGVTNLYAKWTITKIAFDNISKITKFTDAGEGKIVDGALKAKFHAGNRARNVFIPAYDAADAGCFVFEEGKNYKISFDYMVDATANTNNLYYFV